MQQHDIPAAQVHTSHQPAHTSSSSAQHASHSLQATNTSFATMSTVAAASSMSPTLQQPTLIPTRLETPPPGENAIAEAAAAAVLSEPPAKQTTQQEPPAPLVTSVSSTSIVSSVPSAPSAPSKPKKDGGSPAPKQPRAPPTLSERFKTFANTFPAELGSQLETFLMSIYTIEAVRSQPKIDARNFAFQEKLIALVGDIRKLAGGAGAGAFPAPDPARDTLVQSLRADVKRLEAKVTELRAEATANAQAAAAAKAEAETANAAAATANAAAAAAAAATAAASATATALTQNVQNSSGGDSGTTYMSVKPLAPGEQRLPRPELEETLSMITGASVLAPIRKRCNVVICKNQIRLESENSSTVVEFLPPIDQISLKYLLKSPNKVRANWTVVLIFEDPETLQQVCLAFSVDDASVPRPKLIEHLRNLDTSKNQVKMTPSSHPISCYVKAQDRYLYVTNSSLFLGFRKPFLALRATHLLDLNFVDKLLRVFGLEIVLITERSIARFNQELTAWKDKILSDMRAEVEMDSALLENEKGSLEFAPPPSLASYAEVITVDQLDIRYFADLQKWIGERRPMFGKFCNEYTVKAMETLESSSEEIAQVLKRAGGDMIEVQEFPADVQDSKKMVEEIMALEEENDSDFNPDMELDDANRAKRLREEYASDVSTTEDEGGEDDDEEEEEEEEEDGDGVENKDIKKESKQESDADRVKRVKMPL